MTDTPHPSARYDDRAPRYADAFQDETLPMFPGLAFTVGDLRALPFPDQDFDSLVARYSVIHTAPAEVPTVIAELARLLCPAQPDLKYAPTPEAHLIYRKSGHSLGPEPRAG